MEELIRRRLKRVSFVEKPFVTIVRDAFRVVRLQLLAHSKSYIHTYGHSEEGKPYSRFGLKKR